MLNKFKRKAIRCINMSEVFIKHAKLVNCTDLIKELIELIKLLKLKISNITHIKCSNITWYFKYKRFESNLMSYIEKGDIIKALELVTYGLLDLKSSLNS